MLHPLLALAVARSAAAVNSGGLLFKGW